MTSMLKALQEMSKRATGSASTVALADQEKAAEVPQPNEAHIYKSMLIDLQYNQLELSREYQALFNEKETEIRALRKRLGEPSPAPRGPSNAASELVSSLESGSLVFEDDNDKASPTRRSSLTGKPSREPTADELRLVLREWERKMKANIVAKTEAVAEAKIQRETVDALDKQLEQLRNHVRKQDDAIKRMNTVHSSSAASQSGDTTAMAKLAEELAKTAIECDDYKTKVMDLTAEIRSLREKSESDTKAIEVLSAAISNSTHAEMSERILQAEREQLTTKQLAELKDACAELERKLQESQAKLAGVEAQASAARSELSDKLTQSVAESSSAQTALLAEKARVAALTASIAAVELKLDERTKEIRASSEQEVIALKTSLGQALQELETLKGKNESLSSDLNQERSSEAALRAQVERLETDLMGLNESLTSAQLRENTLKQSLESAEAKSASLQSELENTNTAAASEAEARVRALEAELETVRLASATESAARTSLEREVEVQKSTAADLEAQLAALKSSTAAELETIKASSEAAVLEAKSSSGTQVATLLAELEALRASSTAELEIRTQSFRAEMETLKSASALNASQAQAEAETRLSALTAELGALRASSEMSLNEAKESLTQSEARLSSVSTELETLKASSATAIDRVKSLETQVESLSTQLADSESRLKMSESKVVELETSLAAQTEALETSQAAETKLKDEVTAALGLLAIEKTFLESEKEQTIKLTSQLETEKTERREEVAKLEAEKLSLREETEKIKADVEGRVARELETAKAAHEADKAEALAAQQAAHSAALEAARAETAEFKKMYAAETAKRRAVHDELMDLKGNIRVFVRSRPVTVNEQKLDATQQANVLEFPPESGGRDIVVRREGEGRSRFEFDAALDPSSSQERVFEEVSPMIVSVMDGFNICLFAYGQTGSGKTFTMQGEPENPGVNGRALRKVFQIARDRASEASYTFSVSVLEVYNETVRDLLRANGEVSEDLDIRVLPDTKGIVVPGLTKIQVSSVEEVEGLMERAGKNRATGAHNMNEHSSRSHLVFTLNIKGKKLMPNQGENPNFEGNLNLVDLAGSERLSKTDATGDRLKEAQAINKSLSALGDVIHALGEKSSKGGREHIPYRNSKLTFLLSDQLGGSSKVGFFANCSPVEWNAGETLCTLRFADRCRRTELGKATKNVAPNTDEIARLKRTIDELRASNSSTPFKGAAANNVGGAAFSTPAKSTSFDGNSAVKASNNNDR